MKITVLAVIILGFISTFIYLGTYKSKSINVYQDSQTLDQIKSQKGQFSKNPKDYNLAISLGDSLLNVGWYKESEKYYKEAVLLDDKNPQGHSKLAFLYRYQDFFSESEKEFNRAIELDPTSSYIYVDMGKLYRNWGKYEEAKKMFEKAIKVNPKDDTAYGYGLGFLYRDMGDLVTAEKYFKKAFSLNPSVFNYGALGDIYRDEKKYAESEKMTLKALEMDPNSEEWGSLGFLYYEMGRYPESESAFKNYLTRIRPKGEIYFALALDYVAEGKIKEAEDTNRKAIELNAKTDGFYDLLSQIYAKEGKMPFAWAALVRKGFATKSY